MRFARLKSLALGAGALSFQGSVFAAVPMLVSASVEAPASPTAVVVQDILSQANVVVTVVGTPAATVGTTSASLVSGEPETLQFTTSTSDLTPTRGLIISQEAVSVNVAPIANPSVTADQSRQGGVILVLAQYN